MAQLVRDDILGDESLQGLAFCKAYTSRVDRWLRQLYVTATGAPDNVALVAVGGYGRRELCPHSDLDLLLLHDARVDVGEIAQRLWYPIWDAGLKLGHATPTVKEALRLAQDELDSATAYLDARLVAGDAALVEELLGGAKRQWLKGANTWLPKLREALVHRTVTPGEVAFVLEPDLKLGRGGLRDAHALRWLEALEPGLLKADRESYDEAYTMLMNARVALHRRLARPSDVLLLQEQDGVAAALGFRDADALMAAVAGAARAIEWLTDDAFDRVSLAGSRFRRRPRERRLGNGVTLRDGQVHLDEPVSGDPTNGAVQLLDVALTAAHNELRIARGTLEQFAAAELRFPDPWPLEVRDRFVELLRCGPPMIPVVESLDHWGLFTAVIPEWEPCRSRPQRNAYHRFTVDRHLCETAAGAAHLVARVDRPDLLVIGSLLHDIGKGYPPHDHTDIGMELVRTIGRRMGYGETDIDVLVDMVRHHLLLPDVATRRDLSDDATITAVAGAAGSTSTLRLLHALTEADSIATGPAAWGDWKAGLVRELVDKSAHVLGGGSMEDAIAIQFPTAEQLRLMKEKQHVVQAEGQTLTVIDVDRPGLFSKVAGVLALSGLDVLAAAAYSDDDGTALASFRVESRFESTPPWAKVRADLDRALSGQLALRARLAERARTYGRRIPKQARPWAPFDNKILFDNDASASSTVLEVRAIDAIGLLYRITTAMAELNLDIRSAKVQTLGDHVVDAFYVRDSAGHKITDPAYLTEIERALAYALAGGA
ncbi:MAG: [protein-PII] uridylyltransferase [Acidimicrobiales bacterium]|nr:[protein-PII] uridylyltransferase [Acidimicrobiales bacterium]